MTTRETSGFNFPAEHLIKGYGASPTFVSLPLHQRFVKILEIVLMIKNNAVAFNY
jgi:hypothetical protein